MKIRKFILNIIRKLEGMKEDMFVFSYQTPNWWIISVSDFEFYMHNEKFRKLSKVWNQAAKANGLKIVFVCGWIPTEEKLLELSNYNNLILNI